MTRKLLIPGEFKQQTSDELIANFLKGWLTPKQQDMLGPWFVEMLEAFRKDVLLHAGMNGGPMEKLIFSPSHANSIWGAVGQRSNSQRTRLALPILSEPKPLRRSVIELEEVGDGDLESKEKVTLVSDIEPKEVPPENTYEGGI